jgi:hypothetical protein
VIFSITGTQWVVGKVVILLLDEEENQLTTGEGLANKHCSGSRDLQLPTGEALPVRHRMGKKGDKRPPSRAELGHVMVRSQLLLLLLLLLFSITK